MQHTLHHNIMVYQDRRFHNTGIFVWHSSLKVSSISFWIFPLVAKGSIFVSYLLWHDCGKRTDKCKLHFGRKCLAKKWHIKHRKMKPVLRLACFFKMQKPIGCGTTTRKCWRLTDALPPPNACIHVCAWNWQFYLHFFSIMINFHQSHNRSTWAWQIMRNA